MKKLRSSNKVSSTDLIEIIDESSEEGDFLEKDELIDKMVLGLQKLSDTCQQLIKLFHYQSKNWSEIMDLMGYKNEHAARNQKYKCIQKLKSLI